MASSKNIQVTGEDHSTNIKAHKHWTLRAGLALTIENAVKEILLDIVDPITDLRERLLIREENIHHCYELAILSNPIRTKAVMDEWFPNDGDWDLFFLVIDLLGSTHLYLAKGDTPICFAGFTLEDATTLLSLDFKPHPRSYCASSTWDNQTKELAVHLVTKMDQMRKAQGYSSLIL
ncbi:hypothetical protein MJO29_011786 [Puccinia striiformis f. sp. tritici]|uniref:Uncharacterized protein n=1 Tax=Puccinia striiformis f. sp. tritici PST-78 TaxID=1165861 RepID=A0A0L0VZ27_9BASI|nr:hypothetical protein Pst134EB_023353 [Puccinia striiformis f. sp. tritici]KAI7945398.1 hypothetical protein MJO29_011786 [Puccinia striiformis f. sp. tritici]KAI9626332.1 hypothetical protein H4Q26_017895 [Puccinia striiformis f. sp. tritici PST-130]KNF04503.1 hypothetical protein PSTG_02413 [Puccinia striiformis f. sp. tritici PST-78]